IRTIYYGRRIGGEAQRIVFDRTLPPKERHNLFDQWCSTLGPSVRQLTDRFQDPALNPPAGHHHPFPAVKSPELAVLTNHQMIAPIKIIPKQSSHYMFGRVFAFRRRDDRIAPDIGRDFFDLCVIKRRITLRANSARVESEGFPSASQ